MSNSRACHILHSNKSNLTILLPFSFYVPGQIHRPGSEGHSYNSGTTPISPWPQVDSDRSLEAGWTFQVHCMAQGRASVHDMAEECPVHTLLLFLCWGPAQLFFLVFTPTPAQTDPRLSLPQGTHQPSGSYTTDLHPLPATASCRQRPDFR